jgi:hypothetical protein
MVSKEAVDLHAPERRRTVPPGFFGESPSAYVFGIGRRPENFRLDYL